jgi:hypothetical protein
MTAIYELSIGPPLVDRSEGIYRECVGVCLQIGIRILSTDWKLMESSACLLLRKGISQYVILGMDPCLIFGMSPCLITSLQVWSYTSQNKHKVVKNNLSTEALANNKTIQTNMKNE